MAQKDPIANFRGKIQEVNNYFAQLSNEIIRLQKNGKTASEIIERVSGSLEEATSKFKATTQELRVHSNGLEKNSQAYKATTDAIKNLNGGMNSLDSRFKRATKTTDTSGQAFRKQFSAESLGKSLGSLLKYVGGYKLFTGALELVKNVTVAAAKANIEYEAELAKLEAVTGASSDEMKNLSDNILQVAGNTKFTSSEVVKLQTSLGKLGFSKTDVDNYIAGQQALADKYTNTIYNSVGGQESYTELVEWASSNIAQETITEYNEALTGGNVAKATQLLEYMNMKKGATSPESPNRLKGNASNDLGGIKPFADKSEWMKATANPLYGKDAKVTNLIDKRYLASRAKGLI